MHRLLNIVVLIFLLTILAPLQGLSTPISMCSWNLQNFGMSKSEQTISQIAEILREYDVVAIQEVITSPKGAQAVALLADELNRKGAKWDYAISDPTTGSKYKSERYAFLWKSSSVKCVGKPFLDNNFEKEIEREPYIGTFQKGGKSITVITMHAITKDKHPESEIKYLKEYRRLYPGKNLVFCGDFNCPQSNPVFQTLQKSGYRAALGNEKTTLKTKPNAKGEILASNFDHIFFDQGALQLKKSGVIPFYKKFTSLEEARKLSDHLPVFATFE